MPEVKFISMNLSMSTLKKIYDVSQSERFSEDFQNRPKSEKQVLPEFEKSSFRILES